VIHACETTWNVFRIIINELDLLVDATDVALPIIYGFPSLGHFNYQLVLDGIYIQNKPLYSLLHVPNLTTSLLYSFYYPFLATLTPLTVHPLTDPRSLHFITFT
jgi:hypothetical protein